MYVEARKRLVDWLRWQPIGPAGESSLDRRNGYSSCA